MDEYTSDINPQLFGAHFSDIVYEGSGLYWRNTLAQPARFVNWVAFNPYKLNDQVAISLNKNRQKFLYSFKLVSSDGDGLQLYYRIGALPLSTRPISNDLLSRLNTCKKNE